VASFALGLLAKPTLVTLPFVLLLLDAWPFGRWGASVGPSRGMVLLEKAPLLALSIASSAVTVVAQSAGRSTSDLATISLASRFANAAVSCVWYLVKSVWPTRLAVLYPHPALAFPEESSAQLALGAAAAFALAGATLLAVGVRRDRPFVLFGWLWYLGTLVPVLGLVQVGNQARADRYAYIPLIGISVIVAWEACRQVDRRPALRASVVAGAAAAMAALGVAAGVQAALWRDGITLFRHALSVTGRNYLMHYNLGRTLERAGRLEEAEAEHRAALALRPGFALARYNYASFLRSRGDWTAARAEYEEAVRLDPSLLEARSDLGTLLATLGDRTAARAQFEECLRRAPRFAPAWYNLGILRSGEGDVAGAEAAFAEALRIQPDHAPAMNGLAAVLLRQGKLEESLRWGEAAVRLRDDSFQAWFNVGIASLELARVARARAAFERAVALDPRNARARHNLARALEREGRIAEAAEMYERAARLDPGLHEALDALRRIRGAP
jgi:tetratricopeptide (TPR) repeat protein